jgi:uncharacterized membrane protein
MRSEIKPLLLIFGILTFFVFAISFSVFYTTENFSTSCGCSLPPWVIIVAMSSLGLFVGLTAYYILSISFLKEKKDIRKNILDLLALLEKDEEEVIRNFVKNNGETNQSLLSKELKLNKVKASRIISKLENKGIIKKEKNGMTNKLTLKKELRDIFEK